MIQYIFQKDYVAELKKAAKGGNISAYKKDVFDYNKDAAFSGNVERDDELLKKMLQYTTPGNDYLAAKTLFEAFPNLNREQASYEPFWAYLSHVDLYPYMIQRFCNGEAPTFADINNHWWHSSLMRNGLSNLWWSVKQSIIEEEADPGKRYHYTEYLFKRGDFRQRRLGPSTLFRHKEAVIGILKYLEDNVKDYFEGRANFIIMYFNKQATLKQLATCDRQYFYDELCRIKDDINSVKVREEASDKLSSQDQDDEDE